MQKYSVGELIEMAVQTERLGYQFYTQMAERFRDNQALAGLLSTLAAKEQVHEQVFTKLKDTARDAVEGPEDVGNYMRAIVEGKFFMGSKKSLPDMQGIRTEADVVAHALGFEKETLLYFFVMQDMVEETGPIREIISEELSHIAWLDKYRGTL